MFLQPQHFQQQDGYHEALLAPLSALAGPVCVGHHVPVIREAALPNYVCDIERCELVTWEGTLVCFQGNTFPSNATLRPRSFADVLDLLAAEGQRCAVHYLLCWARTISSTAL